MNHASKDSNKSPFVVSGVAMAILLVLGFVLYQLKPNQTNRLPSDLNTSAKSDTSETGASVDGDRVLIGGVLRPASDVQLTDSTKNTTKDTQANFDYGQQKGIDPQTNAETASIYTALTTNVGAERLSPFLPAAPFDAEAYARDPQKYLNTIEPSRVWQSAQPGNGVPVLAAATSTHHRMKQGESIALKVACSPGKPVTFVSFDLGAFDSGLNSISVAADEAGVATANFTAPPGTIAEVKILAASPTASGNVRFTIDVVKTAN